MEKEISSATMLGVSLIAMGAVLGIVVYTIFIGNMLRDDFANTSIETLDTVKTGQLRSLMHEKNIMPAAASYVMLQENNSAVISTVCGICHKNSNCLIAHPNEVDSINDICNKCKKNIHAGLAGDCLKGHLRGKVSIQPLENNNNTFYAVIHRETCNWHMSDDKMGCTCDDGDIDSEIETVYTEWEKTRVR